MRYTIKVAKIEKIGYQINYEENMMKNSTTTTMNETKIRDILCEYLGRRKAEKVAQMIYSAIEEETKHIHNSKEFFVREDEKGELVISMKSQVTESVKEILKKI